jgi:Uma2 family endonuclease
VVEGSSRGTAWISINVTDREHGWKENHRCPDGAVILVGNPGRWIGKRQAAFLGGPDMAVEILSEDDPTYQKLDFYKSRGVREVLVVDPDTGEPELWRLAGAEYVEVPAPLQSEVTGLIYSARNGHLEIGDPASGRRWTL